MAGEEQRIVEAGKIVCHEMVVESVSGHTRAHILWVLEGYYERIKKHPNDRDLRTRIRIYESALASQECAIDKTPKLEYNEERITIESSLLSRAR